MPFYQKRGEIPTKRHIQFRNNDNKLLWEELISREGFSNIYSNVYHKNPPTSIEEVGEFSEIKLLTGEDKHSHRHIPTSKIKSGGNCITSRVPLLFNDDLIISKAHVESSMDLPYKNGCADEVLFIHEGVGTLHSNFGNINLKSGDYLVIPRGVIWEIHVEINMKVLAIESSTPVETPERYRNKFGQLLEHSPFCERDLRRPEKLETHDVEGDFTIMIKKEGNLHEYIYASHPFDVIGWDGYNYPYAFSIHDFEPITGRVHQPPPVHQTFEAAGFVVCSFCPRLYDYHPKAIPAPYNHSNIDSDEVLYYVDGDFMSRNNIEKGQVTLHPAGIPHGPHPGAMERSIGETVTEELAVMVDTFKPLKVTQAAMDLVDGNYHQSWLKNH